MRVGKPPDRERQLVRMAREGMTNALTAFFARNKRQMVQGILDAYEPPKAWYSAAHKASYLDEDLGKLLLRFNAASFKDLPKEIQDYLEQVAIDGGTQGLAVIDKLGSGLVDLVHTAAVEWAEEHAGELIKLIEPATLDMVRVAVRDALEGGWSNDRLANALMDNTAFSAARAERIARTELAMADISGNLEAWKQGGVANKVWLLAQAPCDDCIANADVGVIPFDQDFPSGDVPVHPNCSCDIAPVLGD